MEQNTYFLGLDIGTDSVGYAVTDENYNLLRFHGEPMWGATLFDPAGTSAERRSVRTSRRRLHRRQNRVQMLKEIFAAAIAPIDPYFYQRIEDSWKTASDKSRPDDTNALFNDTDFADKEYHRLYPTIHHLLCELMEDKRPHDVRLVYLACAWLVAHRGHFFSELSVENILLGGNFTEAYDSLLAYLNDQITAASSDNLDEVEFGMWNLNDASLCEKLKKAMQEEKSISKKDENIREILLPESDKLERYPIKLISKLLAGGTVSAQKLSPTCEEDGSITLDCDDEKFEEATLKLGEDGELLRLLKQLYDAAALIRLLNGKQSISQAKVEIYNQHNHDLKGLKHLFRTYIPTERKLYNDLFTNVTENNYPAYTCDNRGKTSIVEFNAYLKKNILPALATCNFSEEDRIFFEDMRQRIDMNTFMPMQLTKDNRTIPHQLYEAELRVILDNAKGYLPFLNEHLNGCKLTEAEKILSIFTFRTPYYIGPLAKQGDKSYSPYAWLKRKSDEPIRPWNLEEVVDTHASELAFIKRMVCNCTYCPGETALPMNSLLYQRFTVLNEINNLRVRGESLAVKEKQGIFTELFQKHKRVTRLQILNYLKSSGYTDLLDEEISGIDIKINSSLASYHAFKHFLDSGKLTEDDAEKIIFQKTCTEDSGRFLSWLKEQPFASNLDAKELKAVGRLSFKDFGRLSRYFLNEIGFSDMSGLTSGTVLQMLWDTNDNLNELLSNRYTLREQLEEKRKEHYEQHPLTFDDKLKELYLSPAVKRQVYRAMDIVGSVVHARKGTAPAKIFVEMARGASPDQKNQRTVSRQEQLIDKLKHVKNVEVQQFRDALQEEGIQNRLQGDKLYLWFLQLGRCPYCGKPISMTELCSGLADIDHIYPQCITKDDSILNNKVLAHKSCNGAKKETYPLPVNMLQPDLWKMWKDNHLITDEKYARLIRRTPLTNEEKMGFIKRQIVETQQTTKAVLNLLKEQFPDTEVVAVKAGLVSEYRKEFDCIKCRSINDLHHAKDAYLNIAVGNVYYELFNKNFYIDHTEYSMKATTIFSHPHATAHGKVFWNGDKSIGLTKELLLNNHVHLTKYQLSKTDGKLFDINIVPKGKGQIPRKQGLPIDVYGGYNKPSTAGFVLVAYTKGKKGTTATLLQIPLDGRELLQGKDTTAKQEYIQSLAQKNGITGELSFPLGLRLLRIGSIFSFDGMKLAVAGKDGDKVIFRLFSPFYLDKKQEDYIKSIDRVNEKLKKNSHFVIEPEYTGITPEGNTALFDSLVQKFGTPFFRRLPGNQCDFLASNQVRETFLSLEVPQQLQVLAQLVLMTKTNRAGRIDMTGLGGAKTAAAISLSSNLHNWKKQYSDVRLIDTDAAGFFERKSDNLMDIIK